MGALALLLVLSGCAGAPAGSASDSAATAGGARESEAERDVGNGRPHVSYDGLMVRRRVVLAIQGIPFDELTAFRDQLEAAPAGDALGASAISPDVLDAAVLERTVPELTVALPTGTTLANASGAVDAILSRIPVTISRDDYFLAEVLVHDLKFVTSVADPTMAEASIAREGIVSDALGDYSIRREAGELDILYTGTLLGDDVVDTVRTGIARASGVTAAEVEVFPRSSAGAGVDMGLEPAPSAPQPAVTTSESHDHGAAGSAGSAADASAAVASPGGGAWVFSLFAGGLIVVVVLSVSLRRRVAAAGRSVTRSGHGADAEASTREGVR